MDKVKKAGCILINFDKKAIALVHREKQNDYSFPKGHLEGNESLIECAIRETEEETKFACEILEKDPIFIEHYVTPSGENVEMYYFIAKYIGKSDNTSLDTHETHWILVDDVYDLLTYDSLKNVWNNVKEKVMKYLF